MNLADRLKSDPFLKRLSELLGEEEVYVVGGYPRDLFLGKRSPDIDIVILEDIKKFIEPIKKLGPVEFRLSEFMTAKFAFPDGRILDIARARRERYPRPAVLPEVEPAESIEEDLWRRDFSINAMAISLRKSNFGELIDPASGLEDLRRGTIRVLKEGSFRDDPTRAYRAIRYSLRFDFSYDPLTEREFDLARKYAGLLTFPRIENELRRGSTEERRAKFFHEVEARGLFPWEHRKASIEELRRLDKLLGERKEGDWVLFFALYLPESAGAREFVQNLPLERSEKKVLMDFLELREEKIETDPGEFHLKQGKRAEEALLVLAACRPGLRDFLLDYLRRKRNASPRIRPAELMEMGFSGREIGEILKKIEVLRLCGEIHTEEEERAFIRSLLNRESGS